MKSKFFTYLLILSVALLFSTSWIIKKYKTSNIEERPAVAEAEVEVVATPYYLPKKNQRKYYHGSYRKEIRMNGTGTTYSGNPARHGTIAADPRIFPFGTVLRIPGYGIGIVEDIGGMIRGHHIDLFMGIGEQGLKRCFAFGRQKIRIEVLKWGG